MTVKVLYINLLLKLLTCKDINNIKKSCSQLSVYQTGFQWTIFIAGSIIALTSVFLYKETEKYYGKEGNRGIDPAVLFKLLLTG